MFFLSPIFGKPNVWAVSLLTAVPVDGCCRYVGTSRNHPKGPKDLIIMYLGYGYVVL